MSEQTTCNISGESFIVSDNEIQLRKDFGFDNLPQVKVAYRFRELGAFWPHFHLHKRVCDKTQKPIISVFGSDCPYPVWHKDEWYKDANPPKSKPDFDRPFFEQAWELFQNCPIPHNIGTGNENCEYTDDYWYSRDNYLCYSGLKNEGMRYSYRDLRCKDCLYSVFSNGCEACIDNINSFSCYHCVYTLNCHNCQDSYFLYDCRNCQDCMFCFNLRNKQYCIGNQQLTKEEYEKQSKNWNLKSVSGYKNALNIFKKMMGEIAWHKSFYLEKCENTTGNYIDNTKDCEDCFFCSGPAENCIHAVRTGDNIKTHLDTVGVAISSERHYYSAMVQDNCYESMFCFQLIQTKFAAYSAYCANSQNIFGCAGLVKGNNCLLNTAYSESEYSSLKEKIIHHMKSTGEWGKFFPGYFAPNPYDESWSAVHWPLTTQEQESSGFRVLPRQQSSPDSNFLQVPDNPDEVTEDILKQSFWDEDANRPFQIAGKDVNICRRLGVALPHSYHIRRIKENFSWMPFDGELRETVCAKSGKKVYTSWPSEYDGRILSEEEYLKVVN